jgi:uncharacterized SAM-binding protein YcdF (DUF218 family)
MATTDTQEDPSRPSSAVTPAGLRSVGRLLAVVLLLFVAGAGIWVARWPLLRGAADLWIVSDPVTRADVVVVLGGDLELRPFAAAELYRKGLVGKVLVSQVEERRSSKLLEMPGHSELNRRLLTKLGVPEGDIVMFGLANTSTQDEAVALGEWADRHGVSRILIPTDLFSARRVRWIFDREFAGSSVRVSVPSFEPPQYTRAQWWKSEWGMITFQNEVMKYIYYRLKY